MKRRCLIAAVGLLAGGTWIGSVARAGMPSNEEQYWLELVNRMRLHPAAELGYLTNINPTSPATWGMPQSNDPDVADALEYFNVDANTLRAQWSGLTAVQPLAWNSSLHKAAQDHNAQMILHDEQSHLLPGEQTLLQRTTSAGYPAMAVGENVYAYSYSVLYGHAGFAIDWGYGPGGIQNPAGHRENMMDSGFAEVGISITPSNDPSKEVGPLVVTQDFGRRAGNSFITGVVYADTVHQDRFYTPGEGLGMVSVEVRRAGTSVLVAAGVTYASGGYGVRVANGTYDVVISGGSLGDGMVYRNVVVKDGNVKLDSLSSWLGGLSTAWTAAEHWHGGVPNGPGTVAVLGGASGSKRTVQVNAAVTTGTLVIEGQQKYTVNGASTLTLDAPSGLAAIYLPDGGSHEITAPLAMNSDTDIDIAEEGGLTLGGPLSIASGKKVTRKGIGVLELKGTQSHGAGSEFIASSGVTNFASDGGSATARNLAVSVGRTGMVNFQSSQHLRRLTVDGGRAEVTRGKGSVILTEELSVGGGGVLDLNDNDLIVKATAATRDAVLKQVTEQIKSARGTDNSNRWQESGITSSFAEANRLTGLAVALNDKGGGKGALFTQFDGESVDVNCILVKYTWNGDANLDGVIDAADYFLIDSGYIRQVAAPRYYDGDFNFDGMVDAADYFLIDSAFIAQAGVLGGLVTVPEPGMLGLAVAGVLGLRRRR